MLVISYTQITWYILKDVLNLFPPGQNDKISQTTFSNAFSSKVRFLTEISLKFDPKGPIDNNPALVEIMAWRRIGDKPLSEPMLIRFTDAYMRH